ncbi:carboxypeptidase-like regulatory domain-containing protein [Ohtaekwangia koreensis]|uniref:CarboxypepD_reg-like domain-containing protein n=1 Tax=Ohtaekwangia koreensis TaxID=688867 RepID=A0A1T5J8Q6_9BACT|nr:carboxypeptidase-like regulatory domain-containing protein [Ohtaekwangia koreensis]SKC47696.1 hypothetical protein SAMN05660236_0864 [Ohtaekwangia koreensis]
MRIFILATFLFLLSKNESISQTRNLINLTGKTLNEDGLAIPFVNISLTSDPSIGSYSNASGEFQIQFISAQDDSLKFSSIGFANTVIPVYKLNDISDSLKVLLHSKVYLLDVVEITSDTALSIVRKSIDKLKNNLDGNKSILQGFYREVIRSDYTYDRLVEAAVDVFDKGYSSGEMQFKVREIRKSDDFRDMDWKMTIMNYIQPVNGLNGQHESLFSNDYIRNNTEKYFFISNAPLNEEFFKEVIFTLDSVGLEDSQEILCIGIRPTSESDYQGSTGHIYIRKKDFAILEMKFELNLEPGHPFALPGQTFMHQTLIKYKDYQGKMYLSLLHRKSFRFELNEDKFDKAKKKGKVEGHFFNESLFVTNEIITEKSKAKAFQRKERQKGNIDLYSKEWKYNEAFWKNYNIVVQRPLEPSIKKDIERGNTLDEQFRKNSN